MMVSPIKIWPVARYLKEHLFLIRDTIFFANKIAKYIWYDTQYFMVMALRNIVEENSLSLLGRAACVVLEIELAPFWPLTSISWERWLGVAIS